MMFLKKIGEDGASPEEAADNLLSPCAHEDDAGSEMDTCPVDLDLAQRWGTLESAG